jgi:hypothetical protein
LVVSSPFFSIASLLFAKHRISPLFLPLRDFAKLPPDAIDFALLADHRLLVTRMSLMTKYVKAAIASRNLLLKPYILWQRDSDPLPTAGVYSGYLSSQGCKYKP